MADSSMHRIAIALEAVVFAGPATAMLLLLGPVMLANGVTVSLPLTGMLAVVFVPSAVALVAFWRLVWAFVVPEEPPKASWWRHALVGLLPLAACVVLLGLSLIGVVLPEAVLPFGVAVYGFPVLIPLAHMYLVRHKIPVQSGGQS
jgi:hypothetical protein